MGYRESLLKAGAQVLDYQEFGSYQGDWIAFVNFNGKKGFVQSYFGSCSGCDAFQSEFNYNEDKCEEHRWDDDVIECDECKAKKMSYEEKIKNFGLSFLENILNYQEVYASVSENLEWDGNAKEMVDWVESKKSEYEA